jgi:predicted metal-dependent hydrolase
MIKTIPDVVTWESTEIPYGYYCSRGRRTLALTVRPDLLIIVRAPHGTGRDTIRAFVQKHAVWILQAQQKIARKRVTPPRYTDGEIHRYAGRHYRLEIRQGRKESVACTADYIVVTIKDKSHEERAKKLLETWYRSRAEILFNDRLHFCHQRAEAEGIPLPTLAIRKMRSRWGTYHSRGHMLLNLWLILAPVECLDYVIYHELCHHKIRNHGPLFWKLLSRLIPECKERRKELGKYVFALRLT